MRERAPSETLLANLADHQAVLAWSQLDPSRVEPAGIQLLKRERGKSEVYRLFGVGPGGEAVIAKRSPTRNAMIERLVYEELLGTLGLPTRQPFGSVPEPAGDYWWLFLEDAGAETYSPTRRQHQALAARWLAGIHQARFSTAFAETLPVRGGAHYLQRLRWTRDRLEESLLHAPLDSEQRLLLRKVVAACESVEAHWRELEECCDAWSATLTHGDFVVKNLRLRSGASRLSLLVFDWEMGAWGARAADLAHIADRTASPNLEVYWAALCEQDTRVRLRDVERLGACGNLLRVLDEISWEAEAMVDNTWRVVLKPVTTIRKYEPQLAAAMRALQWRWHG
jgi:hypothetical protein